ncbi:MAG: hypothetical protein ABJJ48_03145, partial [Marinomonas sp.]
MRNYLMTAVALGAVASMLAAPQEAQADTCLLDTDNDGVVDALTDTDGGADDQADSESVACGNSAIADPENTDGDGATALGDSAVARGPGTLAIGNSVVADGIGAVAVGGDADSAGANVITRAVGD